MSATMQILVILMLFASATAGAQTIYKCTADGKPTYSDTPCQAGTSAVIDVPRPPQVDTSLDTSADLARTEKLSAQMEKERHKREAQDEREQERSAKAADAQRKKCDAARLKQKEAEQAASNASLKKYERAQATAARAADAASAECKQ